MGSAAGVVPWQQPSASRAGRIMGCVEAKGWSSLGGGGHRSHDNQQYGCHIHCWWASTGARGSCWCGGLVPAIHVRDT
jgi:hypothetical protein